MTNDHAVISESTKIALVFQPFVRLRYNKNGIFANQAKKSTLNDIWVMEKPAIPIINNQKGLILLKFNGIAYIFYR
jgi:Ca2+-dependent lipid-binding protein